MFFNWKPIISFVVVLSRPALDTLVYLKTQFETQENWFIRLFSKIYKKIDIIFHGKLEEPCWEIGKIYNVNEDFLEMPLYFQKTPVGMNVWSIKPFLKFTKDCTQKKMKPCFISIRYISKFVEYDIELGSEFYVCGNELLSAEFVNWWIKTRFGSYWNNYSPVDTYKIVLMDTQLNVLEIGPSDVVVLKENNFSNGKQYEVFNNILNFSNYILTTNLMKKLLCK